MHWMKSGYRNTKYFHLFASERRVNKIKNIEKGGWECGGGRRGHERCGY